MAAPHSTSLPFSRFAFLAAVLLAFSAGAPRAGVAAPLFEQHHGHLRSLGLAEMGPGWHTLTLGERRRLSTGLYIIRLTQEGQNLTSRAAVVR